MKAFLTGILGALLMLASFVAGTIWQSRIARIEATRELPYSRYEMRVRSDGSVVRLDRVTGQLRAIDAKSEGYAESWSPFQETSHAPAFAEQKR
jgi:hypothetical protein